ncbi:MAG: SDR family NAD(P)-dependent oxidoreductase, partial [[Clostridium] cellulosi]
MQNSHSEGLLYLVKALGNTAENKIELVIVSDNVNEVTGRESRINPENAITFGMGKCIGMEYENIRCRMIDFDEHTDAAVLVKELCNEADDWVVAYRDGERYVDVIEKVDKSALNDSGIPQVSEGVCLITGGTGRLGLEAAKLIASKGKANIALVSRTPVPDRTEWDNILAEGADKRLCSVINTVREIEKSGSKVRCWSCDITSADSLSNLLAELRREYGRIGGVIHCAAVGVGSGGALINQETWESVNAVLLPKVRGTWLLDKLTRQDKPDYFVMYSSGITLIGGYCSCSYTAANSYLDSFAAARNRSGLRTLAIDWPVWENDQLKYGVYDKNLMFKILPIEKGLQCLDELMHKDIARVIVGEMNFESEILTMEGRIPLRLSDE